MEQRSLERSHGLWDFSFFCFRSGRPWNLGFRTSLAWLILTGLDVSGSRMCIGIITLRWVGRLGSRA